ncbi:MAG: Clp protease N-terminal domain-containing protein [Planctomycetota bacterium]|jgi:ATP-dependent Clp protease ATP-binding subunit ClpC
MTQPQARNLFEVFDDKARNVVQLAREEVARTKRGEVGAEHLLLAMLRQEDTPALEVLAKANVDPAKLATAVDEVCGTGDVTEMPEQLPFSQSGAQVLQITLQAAGQMFHPRITTAHLLLALIQDPQGPLAQALAKIESSQEAVGRPLMEHLQAQPADENMRQQAMAAQQAAAQKQRRPAGNGQFTESADRVLADATRIARDLQHAQVGTVHLMLALMQDQDRLGHNLFLKLGIRPEDVRQELQAQLRATPAPEAAPSAS